MAKELEHEEAYYYDLHPTEEDLMGEALSYGLIGVKEYFAYDPNMPPLSRKSSQRLWGWQLVKGSHTMRPLPLRPDGSLWSQYLESILVPEGQYLRFYDGAGHLRLTRAEAESEARQLAEMRAETEAEARRLAEMRAEMLAEKLHSLGIDPDQP